MKALVISLFFTVTAAKASDINSTYSKNCAQCHGQNRLGISGPPLIPQNFAKRTKKKTISKIIEDGVISSQMPAFKGVLTKAQIQKLTDYIFTPVSDKQAQWDLKQINASRKVINIANDKSLLPKGTDPLNLFTVVEIADHHISLLDGDQLKVLKRLPTKRGVHGGAKYSSDGRYMYLSSRDGWVEKFDMHRMEKLTEIRVAINTRNIAISSDGKYVLAGNFLPHNLVLLDAQSLKPIRIIKTNSRVSAVYNAPPRKSFIIALKDIPEIWELSYKQKLTKIKLDEKIENFSFDQKYTRVMGTAHKNTVGQVIDLDSAKKIATLDIKGMPHLGSGITFNYKGSPVMAAPNMKKGLLSIINMKDWKTVKNIKTKGPGFFLRSHEKTKYAWADVFWGPNKDLIHVIDKDSLKIVKTLKPSPGETAAHIEFDRHGKYALVSIWENDGALIVYDAKTFKELKRIPMKKPSGKYNVFNKINFSEGTSH